MELNIVLPSKPRIISEDARRGVYEIDGLYSGYGHTLGNSLRRIILSSIVGTAITSVKVIGAPHEFTTLPGLKEDVLSIILNLKKVYFKMAGEGPQAVTIKAQGAKVVKAGDIIADGQVEVFNPDQVIATLTHKSSSLEIEFTLEKGIGYVPKEVLKAARPSTIGLIVLDAAFTPIRRVSYEVENMRVGDRTDFNRLRLNIETTGGVAPREALERSIRLMIEQLQAVVGFQDEERRTERETPAISEETKEPSAAYSDDVLKLRLEDLPLSLRAGRVLIEAGVKTLGGLTKKREADLLAMPGLGIKSVAEIKGFLASHNLTLKS